MLQPLYQQSTPFYSPGLHFMRLLPDSDSPGSFPYLPWVFLLGALTCDFWILPGVLKSGVPGPSNDSILYLLNNPWEVSQSNCIFSQPH